MTHEEKEAIRERHGKITLERIEFMTTQFEAYQQKAEKRPEFMHYVKEIAGDIELMRCELDVITLLAALDKAESRIEALERAITKGVVPCRSCIHDFELVQDGECVVCSDDFDNWQFDEARFSKPEKQGE